MENWLLYFLKSSGLMVSFYITYHFLLRKETFFNNNRWFLLSGLFIAAALPLFFIKKTVVIDKPSLSVNDLIALSNHHLTTAKSNVNTLPINWFEMAFYLYTAVLLILIIRMLLHCFSLYKLLKNKNIEHSNQFKIIDLEEDIAPFSFFNFIVYNSSKYSANELKTIVLHEKIHSQQRHSIDVLLANLFCTAFWFNPFIWLYKNAIVQNLEYIADNQAIQLIDDKKCYQMALLKIVSHQNYLPITNHFYQSLIKKRIVMLNKNQSNRRNSWKYTVVIPVLIAFVFLFQVKVVAQEKKTIPRESVTERVTYMDWNKDTPDQELKNDIKALKEIGITLKYSKLKRNENGEITAIKVEFEDTEGHSGDLQYNETTPIKPIRFYKTENGIGFGEPKVRTSLNTEENQEALMENLEDISSKNAAKIDIEIPEPPTPPTPNKITKSIVLKKKGTPTEKPLIIIDGKKFDEAALNDLDPANIESVAVLKDNNATKIYGKEGENGVIVVTTKVIKTAKKSVIITNDNGDNIVIMNNNALKVPGHPMTTFTETSPVLIINGNIQNNPKSVLEIMDVSKIKSIRVLDENDAETEGTTVKKVIISTK